MKQHILVISQYFYPEEFRINDICKEWVKRGYKVTVITGIPNYPQGKFYKGYGWFKQRKEEYEGVHVIRLPLIARGKNAIMLVLNYFSFIISGFFWKTFTNIKADKVFIFEVSPMTQALVGVWYAKRRKIPCYLYVQDLWPENVEIVTGIHSPMILGSIGKMVNYIYKRCEHIFATSPSFVKEIQKRCEDKNKVTYWPQYAEEFYLPMDKNVAVNAVSEIPNNNKFKIIFTGNIGQAQGLEILPPVAKILKETERNIEFVVVGDGRCREDFENLIKENDVEDMFTIIGRQQPERIPEMLACCDAAFLSFMDNDLFAKTIPAKLQSYMACGMPIVASASGESERVIKEAQCGVCSAIGDVNGLVEKVEDLLKLSDDEMKQMAQNARDYYEEHFAKQQLLDEIQSYFE